MLESSKVTTRISNAATRPTPFVRLRQHCATTARSENSKLCAHLSVLLRGKLTDDLVHGYRRRRRVEYTEHKVADLSRFERHHGGSRETVCLSERDRSGL